MFSAKRTYHTNLRPDTTKQRTFRGDFLFVRRKRHARVRSVVFHIKPWCWKTYRISGIGGHIWPNRFYT